MRNVLVSPDGAAQQAGTEILSAGGNAADAVVAALLAGATRASAASLLGSGVVLIAGAGVGAHVIDGRARAPGLGTRRPTAPLDPPVSWRAAVPGILEGALTAHNRFGSMALGTVVRTAVGAVKDAGADVQTRARTKFLEALPRSGLNALERLGILQSIMQAAGPLAGGVITRGDLNTVTPPVRALVETIAGEQEILTVPVDPPARFPPPTLPKVPVGVALCADMHGVIACAVWAVAPEAIALAGDTGLSLAALSSAPTKGITRRRPGAALPMPIPAAIVRHHGRAWAGVSAAGEGDVEYAAMGYLRARLESAGIAVPAYREADEGVRGVVLWVVREAGDTVRTVSEAVSQ